MKRQHPLLKIVSSLIVGVFLGGVFGALFGWVASWFAMGPDVWQGIRESAPWFAVMGGVAGFVIGIEKQ